MFYIYLVLCKSVMEHQVMDKYLGTVDAEIVGQKGLLWHPQLHPSLSTIMLDTGLFCPGSFILKCVVTYFSKVNFFSSSC
jgi:hypothetical protein